MKRADHLIKKDYLTVVSSPKYWQSLLITVPYYMTGHIIYLISLSEISSDISSIFWSVIISKLNWISLKDTANKKAVLELNFFKIKFCKDDYESAYARFKMRKKNKEKKIYSQLNDSS